VEPLAAGGLYERDGPVDASRHEAFDFEELVDRGVGGHAHDHDEPPGRNPMLAFGSWRRSPSSAPAASSSRASSSRTCAATKSSTARSGSRCTTSTPGGSPTPSA